MKKIEKEEKPMPKKCICGAAAITVKTRLGHMVTCPDPMNCKANLRTAWIKNRDLAVTTWNNLIDLFSRM